MLHYNRIDVSEGIDVNKTSESKECDICHYWFFLDKEFKFHPDICNEWHDVLMMSVNLSDMAILNIHGADYRCIISGISKCEAINLIQNIDLTEKKWNIIKHKNLLSHIKMGKDILTFGDVEIKKNINFTTM